MRTVFITLRKTDGREVTINSNYISSMTAENDSNDHLGLRIPTILKIADGSRVIIEQTPEEVLSMMKPKSLTKTEL